MNDGRSRSCEKSADAAVRYETLMRPFAEANQDLADGGGTFLLPRTRLQLDARNRVLASLSSPDAEAMPGKTSKAVHSALKLPDYGRMRNGSRE